jgi:hypothetical protein
VPRPAPDANPDAAAPAAVKPEVARAGWLKRKIRIPKKAWRKRFAAQRKKIADAEQELDVLQREPIKPWPLFRPQKAMNEQFTRTKSMRK